MRKIALVAGSALASSWVRIRAADVMTYRDTVHPARGGIERRVDAVTADVIQVGIIFMNVYGRGNADAFFLTADIVPTVYRRIIAGRFRRTVHGADPEPESTPA
ncbi:hypothetical protein ASD28_10430 [Massilia sp. Root133]|nr:hypothetical protein ASD28_10430 [Massilia sp. Root133]KQZ53165.1 hypothetical protein ASD92_14190 [Massilia sp. Root1485]